MAASSPSPEETAAWQKRLAAQANNRAWRLSESRSHSTAESEEMLHAAHAAMHLWSIVGTEHHKAHAALLLAHVHALLGNADPAERYLAACARYLCSPQREAWEVAIFHAVAAGVAAAREDAGGHALHHAKARELIDALADKEDRDILEATLAVVPPLHSGRLDQR